MKKFLIGLVGLIIGLVLVGSIAYAQIPIFWYPDDNEDLTPVEDTWGVNLPYGDLTVGGDINLGDDQYLYLNTAKTYGFGFNSDAGDIVMYGDGILATIGEFAVCANASMDGSGNWMPVLALKDDGKVILQNTAQGSAGDRYFEIDMTDGVRLKTGVYSALILADTVAGSNKTFQFPNLSGTLVTTAGAGAAIDIGNYDLTVDTNTFHVDSSSNQVGIGTVNPAYPLHIERATGALNFGMNTGSDNAVTIQFINNNSEFHLGINNIGDFRLRDYDLSADRLTITNTTGYVGVHTTGPDRVLDVLDASNPQLRLTHTDGSVYTDFQVESNGYLGILPSGSRVGIGTTSPATALEIVGTVTATAFVGNLTGNATTATALAANGGNCGAGNSPLGVGTTGTVEGCFDVWTEAENTAAGYISATLTEEEVEDFAGGMVTGNTETGITVTYNDADNTFDFIASAGGTAWDDIVDPDNNGLTTINFDNAGENTVLTNVYDAAGSFLKIDNTDADLANNTYLLDLEYTDDGQSNADFFKCSDANGTIKFKIEEEGNTTIVGSLEAGSITEGGVAVHNNDEMDASSELLAIIDDETGTGLVVFNDSPTFVDDITLHTTGVKITGDGDGALTLLGLGDGADESITINLDDTADEVDISTSTSVANVDFNAMNLMTDLLDLGTNTLNDTDLGYILGWKDAGDGSKMDGEDIKDDTIDDDSIDWGDISIADLTVAEVSGAIVWDFGGATSFEIPNGTSGTTDAAGELYLDTNGIDSGVTTGVLQIYDGTRNVYLFGMDTTPQTDDYIMKYDAALHKLAWEADAGGSGLGIDGWTDPDETWTYASVDDPTFTFTISGDKTGKYSAGMKIELTQTTVKYFIITKVAYSDPNTTITVYGGTDYDLANAAITSPYYSPVKAPQGFPLDPTKWTVEVTRTGLFTQANPVQNTWYNADSITIPIGSWIVSYDLCIQANVIAGGNIGLKATLSTTNNSETDVYMSIYTMAGGVIYNIQQVHKSKVLNLATKDIYYINVLTDVAGVENLHIRGDFNTAVYRAVCAYL